MSSPPAHLSHRTLLPGALLALLVTSAALMALAVVIAVGPDGPARLWLDGGGSTVNLQPGGQAGAAPALALPGSPAAFLTAAPTAGAKGAVTLAATPRTTARLRGNTRVQRRTVRVPASPTRPAPSGSTPTTPATPGSTPAAATPRPVSTPAPGSTVVKTRGHAKDTGSTPVAVPRERVAPSAAGGSATLAPASPAPVVDKRPTPPPAEPDTGADVLHHVPPPPGTFDTTG
jgi:hypothetical protein